MLNFILLGLGVMGITLWYSYEKYRSHRRYITAPYIIDRIPDHSHQDNGYIPSVMDFSSSPETNEEVPPKYEDINLYS